MKDKLIEQALKEHRIARYIPTFVSVLETYRELIEADNKQRIAHLEEALSDLIADRSGKAKSCGHEFDCICAMEKAKSLLK